jgi:hypothetical protein
MPPLIWICVSVYALAMSGVSFAAHRIVENFGMLGGLVTIAAILSTAAYFDGRRCSPQGACKVADLAGSEQAR